MAHVVRIKWALQREVGDAVAEQTGTLWVAGKGLDKHISWVSWSPRRLAQNHSFTISQAQLTPHSPQGHMSIPFPFPLSWQDDSDSSSVQYNTSCSCNNYLYNLFSIWVLHWTENSWLVNSISLVPSSQLNKYLNEWFALLQSANDPGLG